MPSPNAERQLPSAKDYRLSRSRLLTEGYKGLLIVNGGGAAALLAFVQAVWDNDRALAKLALGGIGFMVAGLFFAMLVPFLRFHHSLLAEKPEQLLGFRRFVQRALRIIYQLCQYLSAILFLAGAAYLILSGLKIP